MIRWMFRLPPAEAPWSDEDSVRFARSTVADLRARLRALPAGPGPAGTGHRMLALSPVFAQMWAAHEVESRRRW